MKLILELIDPSAVKVVDFSNELDRSICLKSHAIVSALQVESTLELVENELAVHTEHKVT